MGPAVANMDYIGYTPFIASDEILNYLRDSYDVRTPEEMRKSSVMKQAMVHLEMKKTIHILMHLKV